MPAHKKWSDDDITLLKQLWANGLSGTMISQCFQGRYSGKSIIGKANRLHLTPRDSTVNRSWSHRASRAFGGIAFPKPKPKIAMAVGPATSLEVPTPCGRPGEFPERGCQYIAEEYTRLFVMCGAPLERGRWCAYHARIAYQKPRQ